MPDEPVYVDGDADRLTQVFANILNNAAKYTGDRGAFSVSAEKQERAVVRVRDNGPGIPRQMLDKIFEPFLQVDSTLDRSHGGLGIGLTLARQLVELHGGTIEARSEGLGKGSEFVVSLPVVAAAPWGMRTTAQDFAAPPRALDSRRILVVDDSPDAAATLSTLLRASARMRRCSTTGERLSSGSLPTAPTWCFWISPCPGSMDTRSRVRFDRTKSCQTSCL